MLQIDMNKERINGSWILSFFFFVFILLCFSGDVHCQDMDEFSQTGNPALIPLITELVYSRLSNLTSIFDQEIAENLEFCIKDANTDWNGAFNFSSNLDFLSSCVERTKGDLTKRICTAAEIKFYFRTFFEMQSTSTNYLKPNKNCNMSIWNPGCEPGWACSVGPDQKVDLKNSKDLPARTRDCQTCCEGFFCPHGITCMIPCPLGAYCPLAKLNNSTGMCDPYRYALPSGRQNHTCGGADIWADVESGSEVFCSGGSYCPSTTQKVPCSSFWFTRPIAANACQKAFVTNRVGDFGLLLGTLGLYWITGSFEFRDLFKIVNNLIENHGINSLFLTLCAALLFLGAIAKSAQFPLHVWLPDAMEGPTPISAIIHAATMVAAGIFLVGRLLPLFAVIPYEMNLISLIATTADWVLQLKKAALSTLLLIIYNCSGQVLTTRERRHAKSREAAERSARGSAQARERWKSAGNVAKQHALGLQAQLSRTFSRKKYVQQPEQMKVLDQARTEIDDTLLPPMPPSTSSASQQSSAGSERKNKETGNLTKVMQALEEDPESNEGFNFEIEDKHIKKHMPKGKKFHTHSQMFKYAYGKLEKEKAQEQQNRALTFSGVISMATNTETRTRPPIEVAFKDLTLTLKRKHKRLLRCVTGKIMPGRVSAVMGPSGAGKTTFLNALAGKATGCTVTGLILINGEIGSIRSYKKITGFVPQDDIVHGNLTVEENLQFSAKCRLSADTPKADKVLVVERVIESLGLRAVRDSLVGTVEKRGISGGQRKRVNVGLEMVMEPSLLILDEPTSGLDSSSSQLLLKALRREALEGVNICMVVHQPSYTLFKMFDDLILLAKGGLTAYHGPVEKVEEYFAGLGINVPDRVNPPDHFIDILEGIAQPSNTIDIKQLPIRWMIHNGYPIPPDMLHYTDGLASSSGGPNTSNETDPAGAEAEEQSFAENLWQDVICNAELHRDHIHHNFLKTKDLSNRKTPGIFRQYRYYLGRVGKQRLREARTQAVDFLILLLAGACLGTLAKVSDENFGAVGYTYTVIAVSLLCKIAALRSFSLDKLIYWRESASGMSSLAYFLSKDTIDHFNTLVKPVVYLSMFYFFNNPRSSFADNYIILVCLVYCVTGLAYAFAIFLEPGPAQLWSVLLPVVLTLIASKKRTGVMKGLANLCYTKWALQAFVISNAERYSGVWLITRCGALLKSGYNIQDWGLCLGILILYGVIFRAVAFFCMVTFKRK